MAAKKTDAPKTIGQRLKLARYDLLGISQAKMAADLGVPQTTLADYELDRYPASRLLGLAIEYKYGISHTWILEGKGPRRTATPPRSAGAEQAAGAVVREIAAQPIIITDKSELARLDSLEGRDRYYAVPYLRDAAAAGSGRIVEDAIEGYCIIHERVAPRPENLRCVRVSGESMVPVLTEGSIVAVDITLNTPRLVDGKIVCARVSEDEVVIKRLQLQHPYALLFSENPDQDRHPPVVVDLSENKDAVIGQVVWAWVDLR